MTVPKWREAYEKIVALLLALVMVLSMAACGKNDPGTDEPETSKKPETSNTSAAATSAADPTVEVVEDDEFTHTFTQFGNARIKIVGAEATENAPGEDVLCIYFDYTNTDNIADDRCPFWALKILGITQNGEECDTYFLGESSGLNIQPGCTNRNTISIRWNPDGGVVKVSCYIMIGSWFFKNDEIEPFEFEIDPDNLMGVPAPFELPAITEPTYTSNMSASGEWDIPLNCEGSINGIELTRDRNGRDVVRVNLTVTNRDEEKKNAGILAGVLLYQDGVALQYLTCQVLKDEDTVKPDGVKIDKANTHLADSLEYSDGSVDLWYVHEGNNPISAYEKYYVVCSLLLDDGYDWATKENNTAAITLYLNGSKVTLAKTVYKESENSYEVIFKLGTASTDPIVRSVSIDNTGVSVHAGDSFSFTETVEGNVTDKAVTWSVSGANSSDTEISETGVLSVGSDETAATVTVTATSNADSTKSASQTVTITTHSYGSEWKFDADNHWKECTVDGCGAIIEGSKAAHTASDWIIDTAATAITTGTKHKQCTDCGYVLETATIPATGITYAITVDSAKNGDVTSSHKTASKGTTVTLTVEPDKGYTLETITVTDKNGDEIELTNKGDGMYTFKMPASRAYVEATFMEDNSMLNFFVDVPADAYYYDAVLWAVTNSITDGTDDTHFSPNATCTRAQAVTFLWRAAGCPAPKSSVNPFADVAEGSYYYDAVLWAVENGITDGTSDTTFSPDYTCTRSQIVTFLWRAQGNPEAGTDNPFTDVAEGAYYTDAVLWAVKEDVTKGTTDTTFSPNADCTRAQIVTFIWRALAE